MKNPVNNITSTNLNELRREASALQMKGAPYMMASVVIWGIILAIRTTSLDIQMMNLLTFYSTMLMMPLGWLFGKLMGTNIFRKTSNPVSKLGFLCTMNQMLYILIVSWACTMNPEAMLLFFAIIFGSHLLPFSWVYDSKIYLVISIVEAIGSLILGCIFGGAVMSAFIVVCQLIISVVLFVECKAFRTAQKAAVEL